MLILKKHTICPLLAVLALLALPEAPGLRATTLARMGIEELTRTTTVVARARCVANVSRWDEGLLWTLTTMELTEIWKGQAPLTITVRLVGGRAGGRRILVEGVPRFLPGEQLVVFLEPSGKGDWTVTSWAQGTFRISRAATGKAEVVTQDTAGLALFDPMTRQFRSGGVKNMPLEDLRRRVLAASRAQGSGQ